MSILANVFRFGWPYFSRYWPRLAAGVMLGVLFGLSNASFVWATKTVISRMAPPGAVSSLPASSNSAAKAPGAVDRAIATLKTKSDALVDPWLPRLGRAVDWRHVVGGLFFFPVLVGVRGFTGYLSSYCLAWVSERAVNDLRVDVLQKLSGLCLDFFHRSKMGDLLTRVQGDTASLQRCLNLGVGDLIKEPVTVIGIVGALCVIDWQLTVSALVFFPLCVVPVLILGKKTRLASKAGREIGVVQWSQLVEMVAGIRVVKAFALESEQIEKYRALSREFVRHTMRIVRAREQINPIIETVSMIGFGLLVVYIAYRQRDVSDMVGFLTGLAFLYQPVKKLANLHMQFEQASVGVERLTNLLQQEPTVKEAPQPIRLKGFSRDLVFDQVTFSYGHRPVLENINLTIPKGLRLGIAGESGSGKSTLLNLLFRFYDPTQGSLRIDGQDLKSVSVADLRHLLALVSQEIVLFDKTAAGNIAAGKLGATRQEIEAAARAAYAHEFIVQLPRGYDTPIGERGASLSLGQRQRLAIARAFVRNAPILVLDEATASLDSQAEAEVQAAIDRLAENRTVICVAHRLSTLANLDHILVLSQGRIVEQGTFDQLLQAGGAFAAMGAHQGLGPNVRH